MIQRLTLQIVCALLISFWWCWGGITFSQEPAQGEDIEFPDGLDELLPPGWQLPPAIFMRNDEGDPIFIPRTPYREFERRNQIGRTDPGQKAPFTYDLIEVKGTVQNGFAELTAVYRVNATVGENVLIPLGSRNFHRTEQVQTKGISETRVFYDSELQSHMISGQVTEPVVEATVPAVVRVNETPAGRNVNFYLPESPTTIVLELTEKDPVAFISESASEEIIRPIERIDGERSRLQVDASGGNFTLNWGPERESEPKTLQTLEVEGDWQIVWQDPLQSPSIDVTYTLRNLTGDLQPFELELPTNFALSQGALSDATPLPAAEQDDPSRTRYRVTPTVSDSSRATLRLKVDLPGADFDGENPLRIRGLEVTGASRETGVIRVVTTRDFRLRWGGGVSVRPVISTPSTEGRSYEFRYDNGKFVLPIWLSAKTSGLKMQMDYDVVVGKDNVEADLLLSIAGTRATGQSVEIDLAKWDLTQINDLSLLDVDVPGIELDATRLRIEVDELIENLSASSGDLRELKLRLVAPLTQTGQGVDLSLPGLVRAAQRRGGLRFLPGRIQLNSKPGVSVAVDIPRSRGVEEIQSNGSSRTFRILLPTARPVLSLIAAVSDTELIGSVQLQLDLNKSPAVCVETISFEFTSGMIASLPIGGLDLDNWAATVNGEAAYLFTDANGDQSIRFDTLTPGKHEIMLSRPVELSATAGQQLDLSIPVCIPVFSDGSNLEEVPVLVGTSPWGDAQELRAKIVDQKIQIQIESTPQSTQDPSLFANSVWLQTMLGGNQKRERFTALVTGSGKEFRIQCDSLSGDEEIEVLVDGVKVEHSIDETHLVIPLTDDQPQHLVQVWLWKSLMSDVQPIENVRPGLVPVHRSGDTYWQLIIAESKHVVASSLSIRSLMQWRWASFFWQRQPELGTADLERMFGLAINEPINEGNTYLYFSSGNPADVSVWMSPRWTIWMLVGGVTLILSSAVIYVRWLRTPLTFLCFGFGLGALATVSPDLAIIFGQVSMVAICLTVVLLATRRAISGWPQASVFQPTRTRDTSTQSVPTPAVMASTKSVDPPVPPAAVESLP